MVDRRLPCHCRPHQQGKNCACAEKSEFHHCPFNGAHRTYLSVIPGISGNSLERLLSSITFRLKLRFCVMTLEAQASATFSPDPASFNDETGSKQVRKLGKLNFITFLGEDLTAKTGICSPGAREIEGHCLRRRQQYRSE